MNQNEIDLNIQDVIDYNELTQHLLGIGNRTYLIQAQSANLLEFE
jgi:hypothetical protein